MKDKPYLVVSKMGPSPEVGGLMLGSIGHRDKVTCFPPLSNPGTGDVNSLREVLILSITVS